MEGMTYFYELFEGLPRCGPGDNESTRRAFHALSDLPPHPFILDIGCGSGMQTIELARISNGSIIALDNHQPFLDQLMEKANQEGVGYRIVPKNQSMLEMDFDDHTFDIIWSEGALYLMGFQNGLKRCRPLLKNKGYLAVTEAVYLLPNPPPPVLRFWEKEYPDIKDIHSKLALIQHEGFRLILNFTLPKSSWLECFYLPMEDRLSNLRKKYQGNKIALSVFDDAQNEIDFYKAYSDYYGYEFFVMQRPE